MILKVSKVECSDGYGYATKVTDFGVFADAILFKPPDRRYGTPRYSEAVGIYAFSIIGPEQAVRAVASGCALAEYYQRLILRFTGKSRNIEGRFMPGWSVRAKQLTTGSMHLVALPKVRRLKSDEEAQHVCISADRTEAGLKLALYDRLLLHYSTPLIPPDMPGQPASERAAAALWMHEITDSIMGDRDLWSPLVGHPEQTEQTWAHAGLLSMSQEDLDTLVSGMVAAGKLRLPEAA